MQPWGVLRMLSLTRAENSKLPRNEFQGRVSMKKQITIEPTDRKVCTILFADIVRSTALIEDMDPEDAMGRLGPPVETIINTCEEFDATVRFTGDGALAVFGYPKADEDHVVKAIECARTLIERIALLDADRVDVRLGIHTGEVLISNLQHAQVDELAFSGSVVHVARKIEEAGRANVVTVSQEVVDAVGGMFRHAFVAERSFDDASRSVRMHEITARNDEVSRWETRVRRGLAPFVGRGAELARLNDGWRRACAGDGAALYLVGSAGVGKSRLVHEFAHQALGPHAAFEFSCRSLDRNAAYLPVTRELSRRLGIRRGGGADGAQALPPGVLAESGPEERLLRLSLASLFDIAGPNEDFLAVDPARRKRLILESLARAIGSAAADGPLLLHFEDAHWADQGTLGLLARFLSELRGSRMLIVVTSRNFEPLEHLPEKTMEIVSVDPLEARHCRQLISHLLGGDREHDFVAEFVESLSDRTPLFIEEIAHQVGERLARSSTEEAAAAFAKGGDMEVPANVQPLIAQRIDALGAEDRKALQLASVVGIEFGTDMIRGALDRLSLGGAERIESLVELGLLDPSGGEDAGKFRFRHALVQKVAYRSIPRLRRKSLHRELFATLESLPDSGELGAAQLRAHHADRGELWVEAARAFIRCGKLSVERVSFGNAVRHFEDALRCLGKAAETPDVLKLGVEARRGLRVALLPSGDFARILELASEVGALSEKIGDKPSMVVSSIDQTIMLTILSDVRKALDMGYDALNAAIALGDPSLRANAAFALAQAAWFRGDYALARSAVNAQESLYLNDFRTGNPGTTGSVSVLALSTRANASSLTGRFDEALADVRESLDIAEQTGKAYDLAFALTAKGILLLERERPEEAAEALHRALAASNEAAIDVLRCFVAAPLARALAGLGQFADAHAVRRDGLALAERMSMAAFEAWLLSAQHHVFCREGRIVDAEELAGELLDMCRRNGYSGINAIVRADMALATPPGHPEAEARRAAALSACATTGMARIAERLGRAPVG